MRKEPFYQLEAKEQSKLLAAALDNEVDRQRDYCLQKRNNLLTRASILTSAAAVITGLTIHNPANGFYVLSLITGFIAAVSGVWVLVPRKVDEVSITETALAYWKVPSKHALWGLTQHKVAVLKADEASLAHLSRGLLVGFIFLALSVIAAVGALLSNSGGV